MNRRGFLKGLFGVVLAAATSCVGKGPALVPAFPEPVEPEPERENPRPNPRREFKVQVQGLTFRGAPIVWDDVGCVPPGDLIMVSNEFWSNNEFWK